MIPRDRLYPLKDCLMVSDTHDAGPLNPDDRPPTAPGEPSDTSNVVRTRVIPIIAGSLVVGLLALLAYSLFAPNSGRVDSGRTVTDSGVIVFDDPQTASDFELANFDGSTFQLSEHRGQIVVLNFWASWCDPCVNEMPMLDQAAREFAGTDVMVVGVNVWDTRDSASEFLDRVNVSYPIIEDNNEASLPVEFGLTAVPETYVINTEGEVATGFIGEITNTEQIREMVALAR